jgi:hypothetical protein
LKTNPLIFMGNKADGRSRACYPAFVKRTIVATLGGLVLPGVILALFAPSLAGQAPGEGVVFLPDPTAAVQATLDGAVWTAGGSTYAARLEMIDDRERQAYLRRVADAHTDPFVVKSAASKGFLTFVLDIESRIPGSMVFQPQSCRLKTNRQEFRIPLDLPTIEAAYAAQQREMPPAYDAARAAMYDGEEVLEHGDSISGLLIFRGVDPKTKSFVLEIHVTTPEGEEESFAVRYVREKKKKKKKGDS